MDNPEVRVLETIISTLNEVNNALAKQYELARRSRGSFVMRARGILDAMEIVESMRMRIMKDIISVTKVHLASPCVNCGAKGNEPCSATCGGRRIALPPGLTILTPEEVAARETSEPETAED